MAYTAVYRSDGASHGVSRPSQGGAYCARQYFDSHPTTGQVAYRASTGSTADMHIVSVWLPLCDAHSANGQLSFLPGSHNRGLQPGARGSDGNMRSLFDPEKAVPSMGAAAVGVPVLKGSVVLFSNLTYHGSGANMSDEIR